MTDALLRAEIERRMREAASNEERLYVWEAVEVAVEMIRREHRALAEMMEKWGHVTNCECDEMAWLTKNLLDPRCAPSEADGLRPKVICDLCLGKGGYYPAELDSDFQNCPKCTEPEMK